MLRASFEAGLTEGAEIEDDAAGAVGFVVKADVLTVKHENFVVIVELL